MLTGAGREGRKFSFVSDTFEAMAKYKAGVIDERELMVCEDMACPTAGSCQGLFTANTMAILTETMGMSLVRCGTAMAVSSLKRRIAFASGERIVQLVRDGITPRQIMTKAAFENAIRVDVALGGSSNTVLHLLSIAREAGVELPLSEFDRISRETPQLASMNPGGKHFMEDLDGAGGVPAVLYQLRGLVKDNPTLTGLSIDQIIASVGSVDEEVVRPVDNPYRAEGGIAILAGNLAPEGAVVKQSGVSEQMMIFEGTARCFDSEEGAMAALMGGQVVAGDVVVIRYSDGAGARRFRRPDHRRSVLRRHPRSMHRPYLAGSRRRRPDCPGQGRRSHPSRYPAAPARTAGGRAGAGPSPVKLGRPGAEDQVGMAGPLRQSRHLGAHRGDLRGINLKQRQGARLKKRLFLGAWLLSLGSKVIGDFQ